MQPQIVRTPNRLEEESGIHFSDVLYGSRDCEYCGRIIRYAEPIFATVLWRREHYFCSVRCRGFYELQQPLLTVDEIRRQYG